MAYFLISMNTIEYTLKSNPHKQVDVPTHYGKQAEILVNLALGLESPHQLRQSIFEHPYLGNQGILHKTTELIVTPRGIPLSIQLQDEVYLRICVYGCEKIGGSHREETEQISITLMQIINSLSHNF